MARKLPPSLASRRKFRTNSPGQEEGIWSPLYDYQTYTAAGTTTQYSFFQIANGQSSKTLADTNMEIGGSLPNPKSFLVTGIQVVFHPNNNPSIQGAQAVDAGINDAYIFGKAGYLTFFVGSKDYIPAMGPMGVFCQQFGLAGFASAADVTTAGAALQHRTAYAAWRGKYFEVSPVLLESNQNFKVTLNFPTTAAIAADARFGVILDGYLYRS